VTRNDIVVLLDDGRVDKPAPTNDCEQLVALFIRGGVPLRASKLLEAARISILGCQKRPPSRSLARLGRGNFTMDEDSKKFSES